MFQTYMILGVTPVSKNVYKADFSTETISCVVTGMKSTTHTISWVTNEKMDPGDVTWTAPSYTSVLTVRKELVTDDQVYICKVQANTQSDVTNVQVHLNFYCKLTVG